ncbi:5-formyltetrahydrofolate cyclo-ligase [Pseudopedobacter beijingensis]|uniref:5-formyltetrahydrofolate cyclo-ligase n=1 Tax=Pseudopedobacter beijingensis TaxID=1207056 RepID=A0ABW4ID59_9SPHI
MKQDIRLQKLTERKNLPKKDYWAFNDSILDKIKEIDWSRYHYVHLFLPITENNEVDTFEIISFFREQYPNIEIVVPRTNFKQCSMQHILFDYEHSILQKNKYGIPEPVFGKKIKPESIDVIFVPLLAFDLKGHRIGYGGGFYDRFLTQCKKEALKVGLSLFGPLEEDIICDKFDIRLNMCITPNNVFKF